MAKSLRPPGYWRLRSARRRQSPEYREQQKKYTQAWYERNKGNPEVMKRKVESMKRSVAKHPEKAKARRKVRAAILSGKLVRQPCEVCGRKEVHAHHDDYTKPLDVRWLCRPHHDKIHAKATTPNT